MRILSMPNSRKMSNRSAVIGGTFVPLFFTDGSFMPDVIGGHCLCEFPKSSNHYSLYAFSNQFSNEGFYDYPDADPGTAHKDRIWNGYPTGTVHP